MSPASLPKTRWAWTLATFFGIGFLKPGPGTWGSIAAVVLWMAVALPRLGHFFPDGARLPLATAIAALAAVLIGIPAASIVERESAIAERESRTPGESDGKLTDPQYVVLDEVAGQWIALIGITPDWKHALAALLLFRLFDIAKPPPARQLDRMRGGFGIMMDDAAAGLYALLLGHLLMLWF